MHTTSACIPLRGRQTRGLLIRRHPSTILGVDDVEKRPQGSSPLPMTSLRRAHCIIHFLYKPHTLLSSLSFSMPQQFFVKVLRIAPRLPYQQIYTDSINKGVSDSVSQTHHIIHNSAPLSSMPHVAAIIPLSLSVTSCDGSCLIKVFISPSELSIPLWE